MRHPIWTLIVCRLVFLLIFHMHITTLHAMAGTVRHCKFCRNMHVVSVDPVIY
jgi:hypothetical protein